MLKRKAAQYSGTEAATRKRARVRDHDQHVASAATQPTPSLLGLPRELRNMIYSYFTPTINTVFLESAGKGRSLKYSVKADHPLSYVCRQIHSEFSQEVAVYRRTDAQNVVAHVRDFNFYALLGYLKSVQGNGANLEDFDIMAADNGQPGARRLIIKLAASSQWLRGPDLRGSIAWVKFRRDLTENFGDPDQIFAMYEFVWAEYAELAHHTMLQILEGAEPDANSSWLEFYRSFAEWYQFRGNVEAAENFWERVDKDRRYRLGEMSDREELEYMAEYRKEEEDENNE